MTAMPTLRNIVNDTPADATDVEFNFDTIETHIANEMINRDGSVTMSAELGLAGNPSSALGAAPKQYVDAVLPPGMIAPYAGSSAPTGWLLADGAVVSQATYAALYAIVGSTYNTGGEGTGNFRLPNLKTRVPVGRDSGTSPFTTLGSTGGSKDAIAVTHTHSIDHNHASATSSSDGGHSHTYSEVFGGLAGQTGGSANEIWRLNTNQSTSTDGAHTHTVDLPNFTGTSGSAGSSGTNANLPPYLIINYIIKT